MFFLCTVFHVQPVLELFPGERSLVHSIPQIHLSSNYNQQLQISHITLDTNKPFDPSSSRIKLATSDRLHPFISSSMKITQLAYN